MEFHWRHLARAACGSGNGWWALDAIAAQVCVGAPPIFAHAQCRCDPRQVAGRSGDKLCDRVACESCQCEQKTLKPCAKTCSRSSPPARLRFVTQSARMPLTKGS